MRDPGFLVCMVPKVASTSLSRFLIGAHQKFRGGEIVSELRADCFTQPAIQHSVPKCTIPSAHAGMRNLGYTGKLESKIAAENPYKLMVVRHPMDR